MFTAGFSETGIPERAAQEEELKRLCGGKNQAHRSQLLRCVLSRIGPGHRAGGTRRGGGNIGVVAQSGSFAESFSYFARTKNLRFSKVISYGNAADLDGADFLEYLADDPDTQIIAFYIEGTKQGPRLRDALARAAAQKPVIAIKGGMTSQGMRAAASHTAAMAGTPGVWARVLYPVRGPAGGKISMK